MSEDIELTEVETRYSNGLYIVHSEITDSYLVGNREGHVALRAFRGTGKTIIDALSDYYNNIQEYRDEIMEAAQKCMEGAAELRRRVKSREATND